MRVWKNVGRVTQLVRPYRWVGPIVGACLEESHRSSRVFREPARHDATGRAGAKDHDVERRFARHDFYFFREG
jgi:hypothetical protein